MVKPSSIKAINNEWLKMAYHQKEAIIEENLLSLGKSLYVLPSRPLIQGEVVLHVELKPYQGVVITAYQKQRHETIYYRPSDLPKEKKEVKQTGIQNNTFYFDDLDDFLKHDVLQPHQKHLGKVTCGIMVLDHNNDFVSLISLSDIEAAFGDKL